MDTGTRPFRTIGAKDYHKINWGWHDLGKKGRFIEERSVTSFDLSSSSRSDAETQGPEQALPLQEVSETSKRRVTLTGFVRKLSWSKGTATPEQKEQASLAPLASPASPTDDKTECPVLHESASDLTVNSRKIPNAVFARKFDICKNGSGLPPSIRELPVAEDKAIIMASAPIPKELRHSGRFLGPFTPQLWYDSGLDFKWKKS